MKYFWFILAILYFLTDESLGKTHHHSHHHHHPITDHYNYNYEPSQNGLQYHSARKVNIINGVGTTSDVHSGSHDKSDIKIPDACKKVVKEIREKELKEREALKELREKELRVNSTLIKEIIEQPKGNENPISIFMADSSTGKAASNVRVTTWKMGEHYSWSLQSEKNSNSNGALSHLISAERFTLGVYKLTFDTVEYYHELGLQTFYPQIDIIFEVANAEEHYHITLLLGPYGYTTYKGVYFP